MHDAGWLATQTLYRALIDAGATAVIGAGPRERSEDPVAVRNGTRVRVPRPVIQAELTAGSAVKWPPIQGTGPVAAGRRGAASGGGSRSRVPTLAQGLGTQPARLSRAL